MKHSFTTIIFITLFACGQPSKNTTFDTQKTKNEVKEMLMSYGTALENNDADKTIEYFKDSPEFFVNSDEKNYSLSDLTKEVREEWYKEKDTKKLKIDWKEINVTVQNETAAICFAKLDEIVTDKYETNNKPIRIAVNVTFGMTKNDSDNKWKIIYAHSIHKLVE